MVDSMDHQRRYVHESGSSRVGPWASISCLPRMISGLATAQSPPSRRISDTPAGQRWPASADHQPPWTYPPASFRLLPLHCSLGISIPRARRSHPAIWLPSVPVITKALPAPFRAASPPYGGSTVPWKQAEASSRRSAFIRAHWRLMSRSLLVRSHAACVSSVLQGRDGLLRR